MKPSYAVLSFYFAHGRLGRVGYVQFDINFGILARSTRARAQLNENGGGGESLGDDLHYKPLCRREIVNRRPSRNF